LAELLHQSVYGRLAGYENVNDAERVSQDPSFRLIGSKKTRDRGAALTSRLQCSSAPMALGFPFNALAEFPLGEFHRDDMVEACVAGFPTPRVKRPAAPGRHRTMP
jgi:hypothetical protein